MKYQCVQDVYWVFILMKIKKNVYNVVKKIVLFVMLKIQINVLFVKVDIIKQKINNVNLMM